ncbi:unnamed protein product [Parascedosporium putredinis]|uniref:Uncharacterized protein n=1 Tax=Parascedosporium putredinis TaxID=1442378 RepID=A0A9P1H481_9PEZI|nr:unnamed protein product [Parascedosporium putredinis]CAI7995778.1 unnamed protein product [Parascedosporium putredinis]
MVSESKNQVIVIDDLSTASESEWDFGPAPTDAKRRSVHGAAKKATRGRPAKKNKAAQQEPPPGDELEEAGVPDYIRQRRKVFDENKKILETAGLRLPPQYHNVDLGEEGRLEELQERPLFDAASGIRPHRAYKDVELERSGGLIPASIAQYLRDYQITGVQFLHRLFVNQEGGILGDDMGLGKTVQVVAFLTAAFGKTGDERDRKRMRAMRRNPGLEDAVMTARSGLLEVMITTYQTYKQNKSSINGVEWDAVVADECHVLKDRRSETTKAMDEVNSLCRIGLTGTAIQNSYDELWTLLNWTNPAQFGSLAEWTRTISRPLTIGQSHDATLKQLSIARKRAKQLVQNLLPRFFLRRMKTLIADQLPKKSDKVVFCPLTDVQKEAYENFLDSEMVTLLRTLGDPCDCAWQSKIFPCMMALQKMSNHVTLMVPSSLDLADKQASELKMLQLALPDTWRTLYEKRDSMVNLANPEFCGKWKILKKLLRFWHGNGDKVLVFSHSVKLLRILQYLFSNTSYSVSYLDGSLSYDERQRVVDDFNSDPSQFVFLISTKAGGVGLNITSANKVVIIDPHWNPSYDLQAQDRAYRIGQTRDVDVFRLISAGTVEEIVYARQIYKQQQANIGYNASEERRYFKGVQKDEERKGEIFGLSNIFNYHGDQLVLREIVNKTNIAEARAGISLVDVDIDKAIKDEEMTAAVKKEGPDDDGGMSQLAVLVAAEDKEELLGPKKNEKPKSDAIQAILASVGVEYTHENSEVVGSSKVEQQLSRRAELAGDSDADLDDDSALFAADPLFESTELGATGAHIYNPPEEAMRRQFCSMATEFGFPSATEFALVVESMTQEERRNCLDKFYKRRALRLERGSTASLDTRATGTPRPGEQGSVKAEANRDKLHGMKREPAARVVKAETSPQQPTSITKAERVHDTPVKRRRMEKPRKERQS